MSPDTQANCEGRRCEDKQATMRGISHMQRRPAASVVFFVDVDAAFAHTASVVQRYQPQNRVDVAVPACNVQRRHGFYLRIAYNHSDLQEALQMQAC
jgi:molybdopterin-guanine dinucleotide biosynthesis protein A